MRRCEVPGLIVLVGGQVVEGMVGAGGMVKSLMPRCWQAAISSVRERAALRPTDASEERAQPRPSHREYHAQRVLASFGPTTPGTQAPGRGPVSSSSSRCASPRFRIWLTPRRQRPAPNRWQHPRRGYPVGGRTQRRAPRRRLWLNLGSGASSRTCLNLTRFCGTGRTSSKYGELTYMVASFPC